MKNIGILIGDPFQHIVDSYIIRQQIDEKNQNCKEVDIKYI
jgi:hypothetical protein